MKDEDVRSHRSTYRTTIRRFADRALCAVLAHPANELPTTTEPLPT